MAKSKKICILTQPLWNNYGCLLQAYALQKCLKAMNYNVVTDEFPRRFLSFSQRVSDRFKRSVDYHILGRKEVNTNPFYPDEKSWQKICSNTSRFIRERIDTVDFFNGKSFPTKEMINNFDTFIIGSGKVWNVKDNRVESYFGDFLQVDDKKIFSYAASFGSNEWQFDREKTEQLRELAKRFRAISVREKEAIELCRDNLSIEAKWVLDPTMLLSKEDYISLFKDKIQEKSEGDLMAYFFDYSEEKTHLVKLIETEKKLISFSITAKENEEFPAVEKWLKGFYDAKFIVTDNFYGMVFSIIFEKPFLMILSNQEDSTKYLSLLYALGLEERAIEGLEDFNNELLKRDIDYEKIRKKLFVLIDKSKEFLINSLER